MYLAGFDDIKLWGKYAHKRLKVHRTCEEKFRLLGIEKNDYQNNDKIT